MTTPSSDTQQGTRNNFDTGPLSWVIVEIREALNRSKTALFEALAQDSDTQTTSFRHAKTYLHQAHGALQIVDVDGVAIITETVEDLLDRLESAQLQLTESIAQAIGNSYQALLEYLDELLSGVQHQPVRLFPYYRSLLEVRGAERIHPADLFFPNLANRPQLPPVKPLDKPIEYMPLRKRFERALLPFLKSTDRQAEMSNAAVMRDVVDEVERGQDNQQSRGFWWVLNGFAEAVAAGYINNELYVKQLFARINLQIRRLSEGSNSIAERLLRDALFFIARAENSTPRMQLIRRAYQLDGAVPADYEKKRYGQVDTEALALAKERLAHAKNAWNRIAGGDSSVIGAFETELATVAEAGAKLNSPPLLKLLREIGGISRHAAHGKTSEGLGIEMATSLLFIENALSHIGHLPDNFAERAEAMSARLLSVVSGEPTEAADWLDDMSREAQQRQTMQALTSELQTSLRQVEKMLDEYFTDPSQRASLNQIESTLHQIGGALAILDQEDAMLAIQHTQNAIRRFAEADGNAAPDLEEFQHVARNVGALSFFIETLQLHSEGVKKRFSFDQESGVFHANLLEKNTVTRIDVDLSEESVSAPTVDNADSLIQPVAVADLPTVEDELAMHQQQSAELALSLHAEPDNVVLQEQLKESLEQVRRDGALLDDREVTDRAQAAINMLTQLDAAPSQEALVEIVNVTAPAQAIPETVVTTEVAAVPEVEEDVDAELLEIFLTEADEVLACVQETIPQSRSEPYNQDHLTTLRRSFHTLKGSGRMVGLMAFGEAAWSIEQVLNVQLSETKPGSVDLYMLLDKAAEVLGGWVADLQRDGKSTRTPHALVQAAERIKLGNSFIFESGQTVAELVVPEAAIEVEPEVEVEADIEVQPAHTEIAQDEPAKIDLVQVEAIQPVQVEHEPEITDVAEAIEVVEIIEVAEFTSVAEAIEIPEVIESEPVVDHLAEVPLIPEEPILENLPVIDVIDELPAVAEALEEVVIEPQDEISSDASLELPQIEDVPTDNISVSEEEALEHQVVEPDSLTTVAEEAIPHIAELEAVTEEPAIVPNAEIIDFPNQAAVVDNKQDDSVKRIGELEISLPLYNIYLAETDELVRLLSQDIAEWRHEPERPVNVHAVHAAHSLAGSSATVGFKPLQEVAHALEMVLQYLARRPVRLINEEFDTLEHSIERIRFMLQMFALGEMPDYEPEQVQILERMQSEIATRIHVEDEFIALHKAMHDASVAAARVAHEAALLSEPVVDTAIDASIDASGDISANADADTPLEIDAAASSVETASELPEDQAQESLTVEAEFANTEEAINAATEVASDIEAPLPLPNPEAVTEEIIITEVIAEEADEEEPLLQAEPVAYTEPVEYTSESPSVPQDLAPLAPFDEPEVFEQPEIPVATSFAQPENVVFTAPPEQVKPVEPVYTIPEEVVIDSNAQVQLKDELDADLLPVFLEEGRDMLPQLGLELRNWQNEPSNTAAPQAVLRLLHTLKGSARMAGAMGLGQHMHEMETRVEQMTRSSAPSAMALDDMLTRHDQGLQLFEELQNPQAKVANAVNANNATSTAAAQLPQTENVTAANTSIVGGMLELTPLIPSVRNADFVTQQRPTVTKPAAPVAPVPLVRVRADILDRLVNQAGEVSIARSKLETEVGTLRQSLSEMTENVSRLRDQLREIEMQAETQITSRMALSGDREFDPLEFDRFTRLQELTRMMAESVNDVGSVQQNLARTVDNASTDLTMQGRLTRELQQDLMRVRMVQFASISERLYRVTRQASKELDKRVNLDIRGSTVEIDRSVLEKMTGPFEHLLRNAIVHGIETREQRQAAGKSEIGELLIEIRQEGNEVVIQFTDDGQGLSLDRIRNKAQQSGLIGMDEDISESEITDMIFHPGFSTAEQVTELAGRGVGMDVVRSEAAALGGRVGVVSEAGKGANFTIHLPLTLAVTQVVILSTGGKTYAVPSVLVEQVQQLKTNPLALAYNEGAVMWQNQRVPMHYLAALLGDKDAAPVTQQYSPLVILKSGNDRVAIHVDEIIGNREVVVKNIGPQLSRMIGIAGATVLGSGEIVLILNPVPLAQRFAHESVRAPRLTAAADIPENMGAVAEMVHAPVEPPKAEPVQGLRTQHIVMVVDDSLTVRRVTQRLLAREGYQVVLAKDGVDALEHLQSITPDVMLVDIEMPRMDGFDLTRNVRNDERTRHIPIIMITSRTATKHRNYAMELGVNEYLGKPYQEDALLKSIAGFVAKEIPAM